MNLTKLKQKLAKDKLTRADVYEIVTDNKKLKQDKWRDGVKQDIEGLSDVVSSDVINKVLKDIESYDH